MKTVNEITNKIFCGDSIEVLKEYPDNCIDLVVTSPPYYKLRNYFHNNQIGQEESPEKYINNLMKVFNEIHRILKPTGSCFVNISDSYNKNKSLFGVPEMFRLEMCKPKTTIIKNELHKAWLAGIIEGEGCIHIHKRSNNRKNPTYGIFLSIHNTNKKIIDKIIQITGLSNNIQTVDKGNDRHHKLYRWNCLSNNAKQILKEVYPYLVSKRDQAKCALYCPSSGNIAEQCHNDIKLLHNYEDVNKEYPEPKLEFGKQWILRNTIIWEKNSLPESPNDRFTNNFEYFYFFTKSPNYYFKIQYQPYAESTLKQFNQDYKGQGKKDYKYNNVQNPSDTKRRIITSIKFGGNKYPKNIDNNTYSGNNWRIDDIEKGARKKCIWKISTGNNLENHYASYPESLIEVPIKACTKPGDLILDPFMGSGTTAIKAQKMERNFTGIELNLDYCKIINKRLNNMLEAYL